MTEETNDPQNAAPAADDVALTGRLHEAHQRIRTELARIIVGQEEVIEQLMLALFARGHLILEGVPGLAKTLMISSLSRCLSLRRNLNRLLSLKHARIPPLLQKKHHRLYRHRLSHPELINAHSRNSGKVIFYV